MRRLLSTGLSIWLIACGYANWGVAQAPPDPPDGRDGQTVMTRGPIHEAFDSPIVFNPEPGIKIAKQPPEPVPEIPPPQKLEGNDVEWVSGYWAWDDETKDFIWVSGIWRDIPPGLQWTAGYWSNADAGWQWTGGYWSNADTDETTYLPEPPESLEVGASSEPPTDEHVWVSGTWLYQTNNYAWRPGYWITQRPGWTWTPAQYVWSPAGYIFNDGFWDYSLRRRGMIFAPVAFQQALYTQPGFSYSPSTVIDIDAVVSNYFCFPRYRHYCFGDYFGRNYLQLGIYPWFSFHLSRFGYSPTFAYYNWHYRRHQDFGWATGLRERYWNLRDNANLRPRRTWVEQQQLVAGRRDVPSDMMLAKNLKQAVEDDRGTRKFQQLDQRTRTELSQRSNELRKVHKQRAQEERQAAAKGPREKGQQLKLARPKTAATAQGRGQPRRAEQPPPKPEVTSRPTQPGQPRPSGQPRLRPEEMLDRDEKQHAERRDADRRRGERTEQGRPRPGDNRPRDQVQPPRRDDRPPAQRDQARPPAREDRPPAQRDQAKPPARDDRPPAQRDQAKPPPKSDKPPAKPPNRPDRGKDDPPKKKGDGDPASTE